MKAHHAYVPSTTPECGEGVIIYEKNPISKDFVCPGFHQGSNPDISTRSPTAYHETTDAANACLLCQKRLPFVYKVEFEINLREIAFLSLP